MPDRETVSTRVTPETAEKLQTVVDARDASKAEYVRQLLRDRLEDDHDGLSDEDQIRADINELGRKLEDDSDDASGLSDPLGLFE